MWTGFRKMQERIGLKKIQSFFEAFLSKYSLSRCFILLSILLLVVLLVSFIIPILHFGRFFGTDDYAHLFHTKVMSESTGISDFYERIGSQVSNPSSGENEFNYPFGLWLFGATIVKITGMPLLSAELLFVILFLCILLGTFYFYSSTFLELKEQKILAVLLLLAMPSAAIDILSYRPSIFILPFLFILLYIALKEPIQWKLFPIAWLSIFIIIVSHTGTFVFLIIFPILFLLLYCLLWGRFLLSMYIVILSTFIIYIFSLEWFPLIANQYDVKSTLLLAPGNFLATKFNFSLPLEVGNIFYQNIIISHEFSYAIILGALIFTLAKFFRYIHQKVSEKFSQSENVYPFTLPISNISHSFTTTPIWIGPMHTIFSIFGFFRIDSRGKCMLLTALFVTIVPDILLTAEGTQSATGVTREISFLVIILPITTVLGLWAVIAYLDTIKYSKKNLILLMVWILVLLAIIIPPTLATTYYLPTISGEDYIIEGMQWLGNTGDLHEKVIGYGYRFITTYTNMSDASYGVQDGYEKSLFLNLLRGTYFSSAGNNVADLRHYFGVGYILTSDKLTAQFKNTVNNLTIDNNSAVDKIYSSKDFGIYGVTTFTEKQALKKFIAENISFQQIGSSIQIETEVYKVVLNKEYPKIERFGTPQDNYLGEGYMADSIQISGLRDSYVNPYSSPDQSAFSRNITVDKFNLDIVNIPAEISNNQIVYRTVLKDQQNGNNEASLLVRYTFYPNTIKREFLVSNDWIVTSDARDMDVLFRTKMFSPMNDFVLKRDQLIIKRHMYTSLDNTVLNEIFQDIYVNDGKQGIYLKNERTAPYPNELTYSGSTLYNMSALVISQEDFLKPGATLHITQFLSPGDEVSAERDILTQDGISLSNFPDGKAPIILLGYRNAYSNNSSDNTIEQSYQILTNNKIPYSEVVVNDNIEESPSDNINLHAIANNKINIVSSASMGAKFFDNFSSQERTISSQIDYVNNEGKNLIGYMPSSLNYNLDTLRIISDKGIPFIISDFVHPPYRGIFGQENRNPQMAIYHNESISVVLIPVNYPMITELSPKTDNTYIFAAWDATIDEAASNDEMTLFIIRSDAVDNPDYTDDLKTLITYATNKGLTFSTPDVIVNHFIKIQNIQYSGSINGDTATINLTNNNDDMVQNVTFRIVLPELKTGHYTVNDGKIVNTKADNNQVVVYASTDIPAYATKEITIEPDTPRQKIVVTLPPQLAEGTMTISIEDSAGNPLRDADVLIDSKYYYSDADGNLKIDVTRGVHTVQIKYPGYETYSTTLNVKGRYAFIQQFFGNIIR
jgi:hypothetical protein